MKRNIVIVTIKTWNIENADKFLKKHNDLYNILLITDPDEFKNIDLEEINPEYIFFPHWSWIIPSNVYDRFTCIVFHITDLPFGKGGSPLQNLIIRNITQTKISAIKVEKGIDVGDIYLKHDVFIGLGSADEIFRLISDIIFEKMIPKILSENIIPIKQIGEGITFKRRKPNESDIIKNTFYSLDEIYNFIRMLDGEGYPNAYFKINNFKISFSEAHKKNNKIVGRFEISYEE